jgi:hypothetical protein
MPLGAASIDDEVANNSSNPQSYSLSQRGGSSASNNFGSSNVIRFSCKACTFDMDIWERKPALLTCGHTVCEKCFALLT